MPLVEKRYAEALAELSLDENAVETYKNELHSVLSIYNNQVDLKMFLLNPEAGAGIKKNVVENVYKGSINENLLNFLMLLLDKGRIKFLPGIVKEFDVIADKISNTLNMTIISATPLEDGQIDKLKEKYRVSYNASSVKADVYVDKSLIGGIRIKIGDMVTDSSIKGRLKGLQELIVKG